MLSSSKSFRFMADVYSWNPATSEVERVSPGDGVYCQPCIHPDGTKVVFTGASSGPPRIWVANLLTGEVTALTPADSGARHPAYSWDGSRIVFASDRASGMPPDDVRDMPPTGVPPAGLPSNLFVMDADGSNVSQATFGSYQDQRPTFSPNGSEIAFVSDRGNTSPLIWHVDLHEGTPEQVSGVMGYRPWYSKHGESIYFFLFNSRDRHQIAEASVAEGHIDVFENDDRGLSHGPFYDRHRDVLLMHSTRAGSWQLWELPLDRTSPPVLIDIPGHVQATHPTRGENGVVTFDVGREP